MLRRKGLDAKACESFIGAQAAISTDFLLPFRQPCGLTSQVLVLLLWEAETREAVVHHVLVFCPIVPRAMS